MTVSISPAPTPKTAAPEAATPAKSKDAKDTKFDKLIDAADVKGGVADTPIETQAAQPAAQPATDQSLEALLSALKVTLTARPAILTSGPKKASEGEKAAAAKDKPAKEGEQQDPAAVLLAALGAMTTPAPVVANDLAGQAKQAVDDVLGKSSSTPSLSSILADPAPAAAAPVPLPADLAKLVDVPAVKAPDQPLPVNAQIDRLVDTARDAAWLDRLSQDIAASAGAGDKLKFRMMPPNLGALDVSVERQAAGMSVTMTTHTADARNLIADARQQMVDSLKAQGVPLVQLSLTTAGEDYSGHRPPTFFNPMIEAAPASGTDLAAQPVETTAERTGRFA
jgi:flagellar hook-length control protein FliK